MDYPQSLKYLYSFLNYEVVTDYSYRRDLNLVRMAALLKMLGHPEQKLRCVLVGGTKGKGSTACLLESVLRQAGYRTGLYVSPHLREPLERISVAGKNISKREFAACLTQIRRRLAARRLPSRLGPVTFFELLTAAAFCYFFRKRVQIAVLEVGMGGRLDATNIVRPLMCVITPVSYDHQDKLGSALSAIAREKIAILKKGGTLVSGRQAPLVKRVFDRWADRQHGRIYYQGRDFGVSVRGAGEAGSIFDFRGGGEALGGIFVSLPGLFQIDNASSAIQAALLLRQKERFRISEEAIRSGLERARWPGRFETLSRHPLVLADGAHNGASFRALRESVQALYPDREIVLILALSKGKDLSRIAREIKLFRAQRLIVTEAKTPRACPSEVILKRVRGAAERVESAPELKEALQRALENGTKKGLVLVTGSLFLVGEAETLFEAAPQTAGAL
ncbi:MAG: bifunctional folylpolyglutamate synthase/dihydrofolate synthase [Candidatus Omnitrophica bacterium]|nr:bifunctional folylpolyglutamate synthase/dihydrofolate synthase [Candidatus Omnitrophota bacterium]